MLVVATRTTPSPRPGGDGNRPAVKESLKYAVAVAGIILESDFRNLYSTNVVDRNCSVACCSSFVSHSKWEDVTENQQEIPKTKKCSLESDIDSIGQ